jgi:hypothetical protein
MSDKSYQPKVYRKQGGDEQVVASGGLITVESGGIIEIATGGDITANGVSLIDEIAALSGLDGGELGVLNGVTAGTVLAGKAVVTTTDKHIDALVISDGGLALGAGAGTAITATAAELNLLDTSVAGTSVASKALVLGATKNTDILGLPVGGLKVGAAGAEVAVGADAAEFNFLDGATVGVPVASKALIAPAALGNGAAAGTGVAASEQGNAVIHKTVLTFTNVDVALADNAGVTAYGSLKVYDLPEGAILFLGGVSDLDVTKSSVGVNADWDGDFGLGTVAANNGATPLATTEQNLIPNTATPQAVAGVTTANAESTTAENVVISGTGGALDVYVNFLVDDADHDVTGTACNLILNGTVTMHWINLGDF